jgi:hypothetical protein
MRALKSAAGEHRVALLGGGNSATAREESERLSELAKTQMTLTDNPTVANGEVVSGRRVAGPARDVIDTLRTPDQPAVEASASRIDLLLAVPGDIVPLAVDAATTAGASNSNEKMLMHQMALIHTLTMKTGARALEIERRAGPHGDGLTEADAVEFSRLAQASARLSSAFQGGLLTHQRLRNDGSQTVTVKNVTVETGAQAIIGNVEGGGGPNEKPGRRKRK